VEHGHRLSGDGGWGGGRAPSILKSRQSRWAYQGWAGRAQCTHAQVGVWQRRENKALRMTASAEPWEGRKSTLMEGNTHIPQAFFTRGHLPRQWHASVTHLKKLLILHSLHGDEQTKRYILRLWRQRLWGLYLPCSDSTLPLLCKICH
jgi:hypothetical protein